MFSKKEITDLLHKKLGVCGNLLSGSKSTYRRYYQDDKIEFNSNLLCMEYDKVWYGDINITKSGDLLKEIASESGITLYVLSEMDARFENEGKPAKELVPNAIWCTDPEVKVKSH